MRRFFGIILLTSVALSCSGVNPELESSLTDETGNVVKDPVVCVGNPDTEVICKPASEYWDCSTMPNGEKKCVYQDAQLPSGSGTWSCKQVESKIVCTTNMPNAPVTGGYGWNCTSTETNTTCEKTGMLPPGSGSWNCTLQEFTWTCTNTGSDGSTSESGSITGTGSVTGSEGSASESGSSTGTGSGTGTSSGNGALVCTKWYAAKWGIGESSVGVCEGIPNNIQDCSDIRSLLDQGLPGPLTNGACTTIAPQKSGNNWIITLPSNCQFLEGGVCGKYGGNIFLEASGTTLVGLPAQTSTGLSHFEAMWCCL